MNQVPVNFFPPETGQAYFNGAPAWSYHARDLDRYMVWLAAGFRHHHPWISANYLSSGQRYEFVVRVPQFTKFVGLEVMATGHGVVNFSNGDDSYDADLTVVNGAGLTHDIADAQLFGLMTGLDNVGQNGEERALDVTFDKEPRFVWHDISITDEGGGATLRVYGFRPVYLPLSGDEDLSTAS